MAHTAQYVTLGVDSEVFAVPVETVQEILDMRPISRLPHAPPYLLGMIDVRGRGVPVVDLRVKLGLAPAETTLATRIVVLELGVDTNDGPGDGPGDGHGSGHGNGHGDGHGSGHGAPQPEGRHVVVLGLVADRVFEVTALDAAAMERPPEIGVRWRSDYISGVGRRGEAFVIVLNLPRLFSTDEVPLLGPPSAM
jgi:purine-binding chemotaxis protein CheW